MFPYSTTVTFIEAKMSSLYLSLEVLWPRCWWSFPSLMVSFLTCRTIFTSDRGVTQSQTRLKWLSSSSRGVSGHNFHETWMLAHSLWSLTQLRGFTCIKESFLGLLFFLLHGWFLGFIFLLVNLSFHPVAWDSIFFFGSFKSLEELSSLRGVWNPRAALEVKVKFLSMVTWIVLEDRTP